MKVGLLAQGAETRILLRRALEELGHIVLLDAAPDPAAPGAGGDTLDLLIRVTDPRARGDGAPGARPDRGYFEIELDPEFMAAAQRDHAAWIQRLRRRIAGAVRVIGAGRPAARADHVWLLAASAGGPEAVERFLGDTIPPPGLALLYVQHLTAPHFPHLVRRLATRIRHWHVQVAAAGSFLLAGTLSLVAPDRRLRIARDGRMRLLAAPWPGPYHPSADQVAESLALAYREAAGMIVFSGLGDDGALGSEHIREHGGEIWIQHPAGCVAAAMPEAALARGEVDYIGDVAALARRLNYRYGTPAPGPGREVP